MPSVRWTTLLILFTLARPSGLRLGHSFGILPSFRLQTLGWVGKLFPSQWTGAWLSPQCSRRRSRRTSSQEIRHVQFRGALRTLASAGLTLTGSTAGRATSTAFPTRRLAIDEPPEFDLRELQALGWHVVCKRRRSVESQGRHQN